MAQLFKLLTGTKTEKQEEKSALVASINDVQQVDEKEQLSLGFNIVDNRLKLSVVPPALTSVRQPTVVVCVVDVSYSMTTEAKVKDANGKEESHGLNILDLVKHSIKVVIECLDTNDYLAVVSFSDNAEVEFELTQMTKQGKSNALQSVEALHVKGSTNLWDGLHQGLEQLRSNKLNINSYDNNSAVLLFTDGLPNINPPRGHQEMLKKYREKCEGGRLPGIVNTYGFGYSLDTVLLNDLASMGNGSFNFIPDSSLLGTIFVNSLSNLLSNVAKDTVLRIECDMEKYDLQVVGGYQHLQTSWGLEVYLGNVTYGQNKDVVIAFTGKGDVNEGDADQKEGVPKQPGQGSEAMIVDSTGVPGEAANVGPFEITKQSLSYLDLRSKKTLNASNVNQEKSKEMLLGNTIQYLRLKTMDVIKECIEMCKLNDYGPAQTRLKDLIKEMKGNQSVSKEGFIVDLQKDLTGQVFEAMSKPEWYQKWGKHYLPSLVNAHLHQYCNNFKDPGVQHYGGKLFQSIRDTADEVFIKLPAPKPSIPKKVVNVKGGGQKYKPSAKVNMSNYYNAYGGCFHGECKVLMASGAHKLVEEVRKGDEVRLKGGESASVVCVVVMACTEGVTTLSCLEGGLKITPWHPIVMNGRWVFPNDVEKATLHKCSFVYNFVLDGGHTMNVNGVEAVTLGHNFKGEVVQHDYYGSMKIVDDLSRISGWGKGVVTLAPSDFIRNKESRLVTGIQKK